MVGLNGTDRAALRDVLVDNHTDTEDLAMFLDLRLDEDLATWSQGDGLEVAAWRTVRRAMAKGWLPRLLRVAKETWPDEHRLRRMVLPVDPVVDLPVADSVSYDMGEHVATFGLARNRAHGSLVGVAVPCAEERFLRHLHDRLAAKARAYQPVGYSFDGVVNSPTSLLVKLRQLDRRRKREALLVPIRAVGLPDAAAQIAELWGGLHEHSANGDHELIIVFAVDSATLGLIPPDIHPLPAAPDVQEEHVVAFVEELLPGWPRARSRRIVEAIYTEATSAAGPHRLHNLYLVLDEYLHQLRNDQAGFLATMDAS